MQLLIGGNVTNSSLIWRAQNANGLTVYLIYIIFRIILPVNCFCNVLQLLLLLKIQRNRGYLSPVGEANRSNYEDLGQNTAHVYSTMQNMEHGANYEALGQATAHVYSTMQNKD